jgi:hypothetical protein
MVLSLIGAALAEPVQLDLGAGVRDGFDAEGLVDTARGSVVLWHPQGWLVDVSGAGTWVRPPSALAIVVADRIAEAGIDDAAHDQRTAGSVRVMAGSHLGLRPPASLDLVVSPVFLAGAELRAIDTWTVTLSDGVPQATRDRLRVLPALVAAGGLALHVQPFSLRWTTGISGLPIDGVRTVAFIDVDLFISL